MKAQQFSKRYPMKQGTGIEVCLSVILYEDDNIHYAYCAALDILGYGNSEDEARNSFEIMIGEILQDAVSDGNLIALLESYGWHKQQPPKTSDLIANSQTLADILNNKNCRLVQEPITLPTA